MPIHIIMFLLQKELIVVHNSEQKFIQDVSKLHIQTLRRYRKHRLKTYSLEVRHVHWIHKRIIDR